MKKFLLLSIFTLLTATSAVAAKGDKLKDGTPGDPNERIVWLLDPAVHHGEDFEDYSDSIAQYLADIPQEKAQKYIDEYYEEIRKNRPPRPIQQGSAPYFYGKARLNKVKRIILDKVKSDAKTAQ